MTAGRLNPQRLNPQRLNPQRLIERKREGHPLTAAEMDAFLQGFLIGAVKDYQMSAFLMAVVFRGLDDSELRALVRAMIDSGARLEWPGLDRPVVDKHSTGGVGDKVSIALAPLAAALGLAVPMISGRGLGHTGGTLDKLEAIPGFETSLDLDRFRRLVREHGFAFAGQTEEIAPLDRRLYALRSVTATVPAIPLIAASIMSKKLAEGLDALVLDVKRGRGAFLPDPGQVDVLASTMEAIGEAHGVRTRAMFSDMNAPLGVAIGNGLETREAIHCLRGGGPDDLRALVVRLAAGMLTLGTDTDEAAALTAATRALADGSALEAFRALVRSQGGDVHVVDDPDRLATAKVVRPVEAARDGRVDAVDPVALGWGVVELGGGRTALDGSIDPGVGFEVRVKPGARIERGERLGSVHAASEADAQVGARVLADAIAIHN